VLGILNEYPSVAVTGGVQVELGDAYGGERRRVVLAVHVPHLPTLGPVPVAELVLRYTSVGDEVAQHSLTIPIVANCVSGAEAAKAAGDAEVREEVLVLKAARARDDAIRLADSGEHDAAQILFQRVSSELREHGFENEAAALDEAAPLLSPQAYDAGSRKRLHYESNRRRRRRPRA
jgi:Ca-activated chloride channel homolog